MSKQFGQFLKYIEDNSNSWRNDAAASMLELFSNFYRMYNPIDADIIREQLESVDPILKSQSRKRENKLRRTMLNICEKCESEAFLEGFRVGAQLIIELSE